MLRVTQGIPLNLNPKLGRQVQATMSYYQQLQTEWCWAACMQMGLSNWQVSATQCDLVSQAYGQSTCCQNGSTSQCNQPIPILSIAPEWQKRNISTTYLARGLTVEELTTELETHPFVEIGVRWSQGGGHAILIVGYNDVTDQFWVHDPMIPAGFDLCDFEELKTAYGKGDWKWTWIRFRSQGIA